MCHGHHQLDMSGTLTAHFLLGYLHAASVADNSFITDTLVLTASTLIVLSRTEDALTEQSIALGLVCTIVDGLRLGNLAETALEDLLGRSQSDSNLREITLYLGIFLESHI